MSTREDELSRIYGRIVRDLSYRFDGMFSFGSVARLVTGIRVDLDARARIKDFLPVLVERVARDQLDETARQERPVPKTIQVILFASSTAAGRAQLAAAIGEELTAGRVFVHCAGSGPGIQPEVASALAEIGAGPAEACPRPLTDALVSSADVVVTMDGDACVILPGRCYRDWDVLNPAGEDLATVRVIRDDIRVRVGRLIGELDL